MANVFVRTGKRFSIDDAFEEEDNEVIKIYGSTTERSPLKPKPRNLITEENFRFSDDAISRDSDSLMQDNTNTGFFDPSKACWKHPKIKENWKMVLAATSLLIIGVGLIVTGMVVLFLPDPAVQSLVFFVAGIICFIPGAYHVIYLYLAVKGKQGYDFYHLPLFN